MNKDKILKILVEAQNTYVSGEYIASVLNISRNAVCKNIKSLRSKGYDIDSRANKGYLLRSCNSIYNDVEIRSKLNTNIIGKKIIFFEEINSTNDYAKSILCNKCDDGTCIIAATQLAGRGRMNRAFYSPKNDGIYMSIILKKSMFVSEIKEFTFDICVCIADAIEKMAGVRPDIKWPNDIQYNRLKVCGVLTESLIEVESGCTSYIVVGIGINVTNREFPNNICDIATSIQASTGVTVDRSGLVACILNNIEKIYISNKNKEYGII